MEKKLFAAQSLTPKQTLRSVVLYCPISCRKCFVYDKKLIYWKWSKRSNKRSCPSHDLHFGFGGLDCEISSNHLFKLDVNNMQYIKNQFTVKSFQYWKRQEIEEVFGLNEMKPFPRLGQWVKHRTVPIRNRTCPSGGNAAVPQSQCGLLE